MRWLRYGGAVLGIQERRLFLSCARAEGQRPDGATHDGDARDWAVRSHRSRLRAAAHEVGISGAFLVAFREFARLRGVAAKDSMM